MPSDEKVFDLIHLFVSQQMDAETFCTQFTDVWMQIRDAMYAKKQTWSEPYDEKLIEDFQRGEITSKEFSERFAQQWGYAAHQSMQNMLDAVHSACSVFSPFPTLEWQITESQLRSEVIRELESYKLALVSQ